MNKNVNKSLKLKSEKSNDNYIFSIYILLEPLLISIFNLKSIFAIN